ncbi:unnamed protein product [Sphenostylis stenocarpa]|uniref:Uncharacterized protein n=1 Tax=Sphenostylis stenocarpa TaxID=92480 RepID=A0AA86SZ44_9FABA|nr:unnamed protein product [Sphenostylis stenocarpa]
MDMPFPLRKIRKYFVYESNGFYEKNVRFYITALIIQSSKKLHSSIFILLLANNRNGRSSYLSKEVSIHKWTILKRLLWKYFDLRSFQKSSILTFQKDLVYGVRDHHIIAMFPITISRVNFVNLINEFQLILVTQNDSWFDQD